MSNYNKGPKTPMTGWFRLFSVVMIVLYALFLANVSVCAFEINFADAGAVLGDVLCFVYGLGAVIVLVAGVLVAMVGTEHARLEKKSRMFYLLLILAYFLGIIFFFWRLS